MAGEAGVTCGSTALSLSSVLQRHPNKHQHPTSICCSLQQGLLPDIAALSCVGCNLL